MKEALKTAGKALVAVLLFGAIAFALLATAFNAGRLEERATWQSREAQRAATFAKELQAEFKRGSEASTVLQKDLQALQTSYSTLEGQHRELRTRVPLVLPAPVRPVRADGRALGAPDGAGQPGQDAGAPGEALLPDVAGDRLSRGAVWMWNSALAGADVPADTCGIADTSSEACAADSGLTVDDAWDNHHINAKSCAADRIRHAALIEFLTERPVR